MANGQTPAVPQAQGQSAPAQSSGTIAPFAPPNCKFIHHTAVFEMVTVTRERIEGLMEGDTSLYFGYLGITVGIAGTAWSAILTVNDMADKTFAGFMGIALATSILSLVFMVKAIKARGAMRKKLEEILPPRPLPISSSSWWNRFWP
jgi:hypothetical protein